MARIFLSHSSTNNGEAVALRDWLVAEGWDDLFLDLDPKRGIRAGERWERALHEALSRCAAAVFLVSKAWLASKWCRKEFDIAGKLCGHLFVVLIEDVAVKDLPGELTSVRQTVDLAKGADYAMLRATLPDGREQHVTFAKGGLQGLKAGLVAAGLDPRFFAWPPESDPERAPYRGLIPLEAEDAGIFLGREAPIVDALERLRKLRESGPPRFLVILGASGAGKSSFLRAGLIPRLARDDRNFLMLPVIRPERAVMSGDAGLLRGLERAGKAHGLKKTRAEIKKLAARGADDLRPLLLALAKQATLARQAGEAEPKAPSLVIAIDQAEELFQAEGAEEADAFLKLLRDMLFAGEPEVLVIVTIRSDSYDRLQTAGALVGLAQQPFSLMPMPTGAYQNIIEGPAARLNDTGRALKVDPQLTLALLADIEEGGAKDALPLLAFTLERLYVEHGGDGDLKLEEYRQLGGINGSIEAAVERALVAADNDAAVPKDRVARLALMRRAFIPWLAGIDPETGSPRRAVARLSEIPEETRPLVKHLIDQRLLATDVSHGETTVEPAHEALLRQWGLLKGWLNEDFAQLAALEAVRRATRDWLANGRSPDWLAHNAGRLEDAERLKARPDLAAKMGRAEEDYLTACRDAETARKDRELSQARRLTRAIALGLIIAVALAAVAGFFGQYGLRKAEEAERQAKIALDKTREAEYEKQKAIANEGIALSGLSKVALSDGFPAQAVKLALAAWPRKGEERPALKRTIESLAATLPNHHQRLLLRGHQDAILSVAFSPDGSQVLTASGDKTARLWNVTTGAVNAVLRGHEGAVLSVAFSPDDTRVVTASSDKTARLWDGKTGTAIAVLKAHDSQVRLAAFSSDGTRVVTASEDGTARLWDARTGVNIALPMRHQGPVLSAAFSPDGSHVATASIDGTARLWDANTGIMITELRGHVRPVTSAVYSPDGTRVLTASADQTARLWDAKTGEQLWVFEGHKDMIYSATFSPDGERVLTASSDKTARLWLVDARVGVELAVLKGHEDAVHSAIFSPDGTRVATASSDKVARIWNATTGEEIAILRGHEGWVYAAAFSPNGTHIATASTDKTARLWDLASNVTNTVLTGHLETVLSAEFSPSGTQVVTAGDQTARLWDAKTGKEIAVLRGHKDSVYSAAFSPDGTRIVTASFDKTGRLWDVGTGKETAVLAGHEDMVLSAVFSPDGTRVVTASEDKTARVWNAKTGIEIAALRGHAQTVLSAKFSPDGTRVVTASADKTARLWDAATGRQTRVLKGPLELIFYSAAFSLDGSVVITATDRATILWDAETGEMIGGMGGHEKEIISATFSRDGTFVLTASTDKTARIWNARTGAEVAVLRGHRDKIRSAVFSPDGIRVLTASADKTARLWDAATGIEIAILGGHESEIIAAEFSPDGTRAVTASWDKTARLWDISSLAKADVFSLACDHLGNDTSLTDVRERYSLGTMIPICGTNAPSPVDLTKLQ